MLFTLLIFLMIIMMFFYSNLVFYVYCILMLSSLILFNMVLSNLMSTYVFILFMTIYLGAVMILIGYVCAVSPNISFVSLLDFKMLFLSFLFFMPMIFMTVTHKNLFVLNSMSYKSDWSLDLFFSTWGWSFFFIVSVFMFLSLIMVTSQYFSPQAPLRSF